MLHSAIPEPTAPILMGVMSVPVRLGTKEMDTSVLVSINFTV